MNHKNSKTKTKKQINQYRMLLYKEKQWEQADRSVKENVTDILDSELDFDKKLKSS